MRSFGVLTLTLACLSPAVLAGIMVGMVPDTNQCQQKCQATFSPHTNPQAEDEVNHCMTGCRLFSIIETVDHNPNMDLDKNMESHSANCAKSCEKSFNNEAESKPCNMGCQFQVPFAKERREELSKHEDEQAENALPVLHRIRIGMPSMPDLGLPSFFGPDPDFDGIFNRMKARMNDMMSSMMQGMDSLPAGGRGQLTVIQSGPGYHQQRTYNFGPKGIQMQQSEQGQSLEKEHPMGNDMMDKPNPLEKEDFSNDVEILDNNEQEIQAEETSSQTNTFFNQMSNIRKQLEEQIQRMVNSDPEESRNSATVHGFDYDDRDNVIEPRVSPGLRPRFYTKEEFCSQDSHNMRWSDWVSCLHLRMGLPRWLTAATLSLGIIFIIWLCLVIPHSAPKQRVVKMPDDLTKTKLSILEETAIPRGKDLPPCYDDIANLHVAIPADQAGPLPVKKALDQQA